MVTVAFDGAIPAADEQTDVLILGAGMSGIAAARTLRDALDTAHRDRLRARDDLDNLVGPRGHATRRKTRRAETDTGGGAGIY